MLVLTSLGLTSCEFDLSDYIGDIQFGDSSDEELEEEEVIEENQRKKKKKMLSLSRQKENTMS